MGAKNVFSRAWAMPSADTWSIQPIAELLSRWLTTHDIIVDPFARNSKVAGVTNDLNPSTTADYHLDAIGFLDVLAHDGFEADAVLLDPPYSPRQISELYQSIGKPVSSKDTQNSRLYKRAVAGLDAILKPGGIAIRAGWNSSGFGKRYELLEVLLVCHGGAHNDTIVTVERKTQSAMDLQTLGG